MRVLLPGLALLLLHGLAGSAAARTLPSRGFELTLIRAGRGGWIEVRTEGRLVQRLRLRPGDRPGGVGPELLDLDLDGELDLRMVSDFGAKWARYQVWRYHARRGRFVEDRLARALGELINLEPRPAHRRVEASSLGPCEPWRRRYRIRGDRLLLDFEVTRRGCSPAPL